ncbi:MAG: class I SAM-dependent methyltransferase [Burkholderiaceae bacterium]|nr:class I SAM-dependent methyltransferase [Burkholderiaceae bacterium]
MTDIHDAARRGFSSEAQTYERGRPEYPTQIAGWLSDTLGIGPGTAVVDLGAGTGKFTSLLMATGAQVTAIEPVAAMQAQLARRLPQVAVLTGVAERMPLADATVDVLVCAQAFHWFANDAALADMHRVLKPGGRLGLVWNVRDESVDWVAEITRIITPHEGNAPRYYKGEWRRPFAGGPFAPLELTAFEHQHVGSAKQVILDRFLSVSFIAALPAAEKAGVAARLQALIDTHPALAGCAEIRFPYRTEAYRAVRRD